MVISGFALLAMSSSPVPAVGETSTMDAELPLNSGGTSPADGPTAGAVTSVPTV